LSEYKLYTEFTFYNGLSNLIATQLISIKLVVNNNIHYQNLLKILSRSKVNTICILFLIFIALCCKTWFIITTCVFII